MKEKLNKCIFENDCKEKDLCCHFCRKLNSCENACKAYSENCKLLVTDQYKLEHKPKSMTEILIAQSKKKKVEEDG